MRSNFVYRNNAEESKENNLTVDKDEHNIWNQSKVKNLARKFNIDLAPKVSNKICQIESHVI